LIVSVRVPPYIEDEEENEPQTREITNEEAEQIEGLIIENFIFTNTLNPRLAPGSKINKTQIMKEVVAERKYLQIIDFDDHFNENLAFDWTNPSFDQ